LWQIFIWLINLPDCGVLHICLTLHSSFYFCCASWGFKFRNDRTLSWIGSYHNSCSRKRKGSYKTHIWEDFFALSDVLHMPSIRDNLYSITRKSLGKCHLNLTRLLWQKIIFYFGKGYCDQGFFLLNIFEIVNESSSSSYIVCVIYGILD